MILIRDTKTMFATVCIIWVAFTAGVFLAKIDPNGKENMEYEAPAQEIVYVTEYKYPNTYYSKISISNEDIELLARLVYLEARNQPEVGQRAVVEVVLNRVLDERFPNTVYDVIYQKNQFSTASKIANTTATEEQYDVVDMVLNEICPILDTDTIYFSTSPHNDNISAIINDHYFCK